MLLDDFVMREIQKVAALAARLADHDAGEEDEGESLGEDLGAAYRSLLGLDARTVDTFTGGTLVRMVPERDHARALVTLLIAHGDYHRARAEDALARRKWRQALDAHREAGLDEELGERIEARLDG